MVALNEMVKIINQENFRLKNFFDCRCSLGEGLFVKMGTAAWVDIDNDKIYLYREDKLEEINLDFKPSVIFDINESKIQLGCDIGIVDIYINKDINHLRKNDHFIDHNMHNYRSNDGGFCGKSKIIGFMHRSNPEKAGYIYSVQEDSYHLIDSSIHIPNSFIELNPLEILVSDSYKNKIWLFKLDDDGKLIKKSLWAKLDKNLCPDGGCMINDRIFLTLWDSAAIAIFNKSGMLLSKLELPILRPTNCKYDYDKSKLWVTSANNGLTIDEKSQFPLSGNTFVYDIDLMKC